MPTTPARKSSIGGVRRGLQKAHIPYRGDNPEVGKKTGIAVRHVERKSDGFEPFDELIEQADKRTPPKFKVSKRRKQSIPAPEEDSDELGEMSMDIDSPRQYFTNSRQPATPINNRNRSTRTVARTSDIDFDRIPSPRSSRKSTAPGPSRLSISYVAPQDDSDDDNHAPDYGYSGEYDDQPDSSDEHDMPQSTSFREMDQDDDEQQEQPDEEPEEETPPPSRLDKGKGRATLSDVPEEHESEIEDEIAQSLEDVHGQAYSDEEPLAADEPDSEPEPEPSPRRTKKIKIAEDLSKPTRQRNGRSKKENRVHREGVRKSTREHYKPLEWWRGEKLVYGRPSGSSNGHVLVPPIKEIIRIPKVTPEPLGKRKRSSRARSKTAEDVHYKIIPVHNPEDDWDKNTEEFCVLLDYDSMEEVERRIAYTAKNVVQRLVRNNDWSFMKAFGDADFIAAGVLEIPLGKKKPSKQTKDNTYIFYIVEGAVNLRIHNSNHTLATGAMFMIPRGNSYYIENICERTVKLFFTQARKVIEDRPPSFDPPRPLSVGATASYGRSSSTGAAQGGKRAMSEAPAPKRATSTR